MNSQKEQFLNLRITPARLGVEETAWYLGFSPHEIPILVAVGILKPLGRPPANGTKYFATTNIEELRRDTKWLARASDAIVDHWRTRNERQKMAADRNGDHDLPAQRLKSSLADARSARVAANGAE